MCTTPSCTWLVLVVSALLFNFLVSEFLCKMRKIQARFLRLFYICTCLKITLTDIEGNYVERKLSEHGMVCAQFE